MKLNYLFTLLAILMFFSCAEQQQEVVENKIWYAQPATKWMEALPVGNGRLGAMVFGDPQNEQIQLNEDSMWAGGPDWGDSQGNKNDLEEIRTLLKNSEAHKVDKLIVDRFSYKSVLRSHQTMGDLFIDFDEEREVEKYERSLNLNDAVARVNYTSNGNKYSQTVFSSALDDVLVVALATDAKEGMNFSLRLNRPDDKGHKTVVVTNPSKNEISMKGMVTQYGGKKMSEPFPIDYGVKFETKLKVKNASGTVKAENGKLILKGVKKATILLSGATSFYNKEDYEEKNNEVLASTDAKSFNELLSDHTKEYQKYYNRVQLDLGGKELDTIPIDKRLQRLKDGQDDPDLAAKLFQYGRYLLISSSRPNTNPANLQGIWNNHIEAPWNADYHLNINLQMNYWPAEVTNLSEMHSPLFDFTDRLLERGKITAKEQYGLDGSVMHHATDLWAPAWMRAAQPYWGAWIHGGGWMGQHYWEHYTYTKDEDFLRERAYPYLKEIAKFYADWLVWDEAAGKWVSTPETSPENSYRANDGKPAAISYGAAMGHQIITEVFDNVLEASRILDIKDDFTKEIKQKREKLFPGVVVGKDGRILEWNDDYDEPEKGHRHMSHLYALHPSNQITVENKEAFNAAQKTIDYRLKHGGAGTGWSRAWMINANARLLDSVSASENIKKFFQISIANNLFDEHPPFQIDGNFGYTAGVAELLMQSHEGFIRVLPALPTNWKTGRVKGLKARGNIEIDVEWKDGVLIEIKLKSKEDKLCKIKYKNKVTKIDLKGNTRVVLDKNLIHRD